MAKVLTQAVIFVMRPKPKIPRTSKKLTDLHRRMIRIENEHENLKSKHEEYDEKFIQTDDKLTEMQWRSMRENLIFTGIDEEEEESEVKNENCERKICDFIFKDLGINDQMTFDRVQRIGKYSPEQTYPRHIVAKFHSFKDWEKVRRAAPYALKGRKYGVREQFPTEIENKRKLLYPVVKKAKEVEGNKVQLVRNKLFLTIFNINQNPRITKVQDLKRMTRTTSHDVINVTQTGDFNLMHGVQITCERFLQGTFIHHANELILQL